VRTDGHVLIPGWLDRRRGRRIPVGISIRADCGRGQQRVTLNDISPTGAGLTSCPSLKSGSIVTIELPNGRRLEGHAAWSYANSVGIEFTQPINEDDPVFKDIISFRRSAQTDNR
jgi:PilZ domain